MKAWILKYKWAIAGWCYWRFVGCSSGACPITSKPLNSAIYGALMGYLISGLFKKDVTERVTHSNSN